MAEDLNVIYAESTDLDAFFGLFFSQQWDEKKEFKKAKRNGYPTGLNSRSTLDNFARMLADVNLNAAVKEARRELLAKVRSEFKNQLISNSISAIGFVKDAEGARRLERIPNLFWVTALANFEDNSACDDEDRYNHIRIVSDRYDRNMNASEHIIEAIRHEKKLHEAESGKSWWGVKRKDRIAKYRAFIKSTFGINTLKADGYSVRHFDKYDNKFRSKSMQ